MLAVFQPSLFFVWLICKDADMLYYYITEQSIQDETGLVFPVLAVFQPSLFFVWLICKDADMFYKNLPLVVCLSTLRCRLIYMYDLFAKEHIQQIPLAVTVSMTPKSFFFY